jgi:orotidine-5'-phosphate decarboxylase
MPGAPALIVALDLPTLPAAAEMMHRLWPVTRWFKVGSMLFTAAGPQAVRMVLEEGGHVFLDLKFHDIPQTVAGGVAAAAGLGVSIVTIHCAAGQAAMQAAVDAVRRSGSSARILGVTRLTSESGRVGAGVLRAAQAARAAGLHGVVASVRECARIKAACCSDFLVLTPGIRPAGAPADDQARVATPRAAVRAGADYLVVGRPIIAASDPLAAAQRIADEIAAAQKIATTSRPR